MKRKLLLGTLGIVLASVIAFTGCDDVLAEIQKGLGAANSAYGIVLSEAEADAFDSSGAKPLFVLNTGTKETGTLRAELTGDGREAFVLSKTELPSIEAGGTATFTVTPKTSLAVGTYTATVAVSGTNNLSASFNVSFTEEPTKVANFADAVTHMEDDAKRGTPEAYYTLLGIPPHPDEYMLDLNLTSANCPANVTIDGIGYLYFWLVEGKNNQITVGSGITLTLKNIKFTTLPFIVAEGGKLILGAKDGTAGDVIIAENTGTGITVNGGGTLELNTGALVTGNQASGIVLNDNSVLTMTDGQVLGNLAASGGGGVTLVGTGSVFNMDGGKILGNIAGYGGGVNVQAGSFTMGGGLISNNMASGEVKAGGGVALYGDNTVFTMTGGEISGNFYDWENGGGVWLYGSGSNFNMSGGVIRGNQVTQGGGGVMMQGANSKFNMSGTAEISSNTATNGGGVAASGPFTMSGGVIKNNTASQNGGGVNIDGSEFTMTGGAIISDNNAISTALDDDGGGGVAMTRSGGVFTMSGGAISGNTANLGGGVLLRDTNNQFTMSGGEISGNTASEAGGGVEVIGTDGRFTMNAGSSIHNNTAVEFGGGVEMYGDNGIFTMNGGEIYENTVSVDSGGGLYMYSLNGKFYMTGGEIYGNSAKFNGGGIGSWPHRGIIVDMTGGKIRNNSAEFGGGVHLVVSTLTGNPSIGRYDPSRGSIYDNDPNDVTQ
jgi:hypothetical protein